MSFLERMWAYITLGAMGSLWGEASPLLGGLAAFDRNLQLASVIGAVALGTWLGGIGFYWIGRSQGRRIRKRWPRARPVIIRSIAIVRRHPWRASLGSRFAYGLRIALPIACGVAHLRFATYAIGTAISCAAWSLLFTILGWALGRTTETLLGHVKDLEALIGAALVLGALGVFIVFRRRHVAERTARVLDPPSAGSTGA
jgi:membrane protein DedA with SNARE-associated domain